MPIIILTKGAGNDSVTAELTWPLSTRRVTPLMPLAASLQRNAQHVALIGGERLGSRGLAVVGANVSHTSALAREGVSVGPGRIALMRMPCFSSGNASRPT